MDKQARLNLLNKIGKITVYDKSKWQDDAGYPDLGKEVSKRIHSTLKKLDQMNMLTQEGKEELSMGEFGNLSLHSGMVNSVGKDWIKKNYK